MGKYSSSYIPTSHHYAQTAAKTTAAAERQAENRGVTDQLRGSLNVLLFFLRVHVPK